MANPKTAQDRIRALLKNFLAKPAVHITNTKPRLCWTVSEEEWVPLAQSTQLLEAKPVDTDGTGSCAMFSEWKHDEDIFVDVILMPSGQKKLEVTLYLQHVEKFIYPSLKEGKSIIKWATGGQSRLDVVKLVLGTREFVVLKAGDYQGLKDEATWTMQKDRKDPGERLVLVITVEGNRHNHFKKTPTFSKTFGSKTISVEFLAEEVQIPVLDEIDLIIKKEIGFSPKDFAGRCDRATNEAKLTFDWVEWKETLVDNARRNIAERSGDNGLFELVCGDGTNIRVAKSVLSASSPMFSTCFRNPEYIEMKKNSFGLSSYSRMAVENLVIYAEFRLIPDIKDIYAELAMLAHYCQMESLVSLCELYMINYLAISSDRSLLDGRMEDFVQICKVAGLLNLRLLLVVIHVILLDDIGREISQNPKYAEVWAEFLEENPRFLPNRYKAFVDLSKDMDVAETASSKKRKLDDENSP